MVDLTLKCNFFKDFGGRVALASGPLKRHNMEIKGILRSLVNSNSSLIILLVIFIGSLFSAIIPPFQSPDEFDHIKRAYLLSKGQFILDTPQGFSSGGNVDSGLLQYMGLYDSLVLKNMDISNPPPLPKVSEAISTSAQHIRWSGVRQFSQAPGTGYYFPLAYTPQAVGLMAGEFFHLSVEASYRMARLMVLVSCIFIIAIAFLLFPTNPLTSALLIIPMSIFQFASASLDAFATSLSILAISIFLRMTGQRANNSAWLAYALGISIFVVVSCRVQLIPLLALPYAVYFSTRNKNHLYSAVIVSIAAFTWLFVAVKFTHDYRAVANLSESKAIGYYLANPTAFLKALTNTLGDSEFLEFYMQSFIGILGWVDTKFSEGFYYAVFGILALIVIGSASLRKVEWPRKILLGIACISVVLIFFALLVTFNQYPAEFIQGVQGRYFLVPVMLAGYSLTGTIEAAHGLKRKILIALLIMLAVATIGHMPELLIARYYI